MIEARRKRIARGLSALTSAMSSCAVLALVLGTPLGQGVGAQVGARETPALSPGSAVGTSADPTALDDEAVTDEDRIVDIPVLRNDSDPDGDTLQVVSVTRAANGTVLINGDDTVRYQPFHGFRGLDRFAYSIEDGRGGTATATVSVRVLDVPDAPVAEDQTLETTEDTALTITLVASDEDGDPLRFSVEHAPAHGTLSGTPPDLVYLPARDFHGEDAFVFAVNDGDGGVDAGAVSIRIHPAPDSPLALDDAASTDEHRIVDIPVLRNDSDPDGDSLRVVSVTQGLNGSVLINGDDTVRYQPHAGFTGLDGFAYGIEDGRGGTATASVSIRVRDVPDAPVAEDQTLETAEDTALTITLVASDEDGSPLRFSIEQPPAHGTLGGTLPDVVYVPARDFHGEDAFVFAVDDGDGGVDTGAVSIRIHPVPDPPLALDDAASTDEHRIVDIPVLCNDSDPDGDPLRLVSVTQGVNGSVLINGDDTVRYQPHAGFTGLDGFAYSIEDGRGGIATATVSIRVRDVPDAPVAEDQTLETAEDTALTITFLASDEDGDPLRFSIEQPPAHGTLSGTPPDLVYLPARDFHGEDAFVFAVNDGNGGVDTGTVSIRIHPAPDPPLALDDAASTDEDRVVDIPVLRNDSDPDGDALRVVSVTHGVSGSVLINGDDTVRYQPHAGFAGLDGFAYSIDDGHGGTATATVSVRVHGRAGETENREPAEVEDPGFVDLGDRVPYAVAPEPVDQGTQP